MRNYDRHLLAIVEERVFTSLKDYSSLLPASLPQPFTNLELAAALNCRPRLAGKITYTLRKAGVIQVVAKRGNSLLHKLA